MKIKDIIKKVNKSDKFKDSVCVGEIAEEMDIFDVHCWEEQNRLVSYYIGSWYCTDSYVGYKVYFFDDEPVAVTSQLGRKCDEKFEWISKEAYIKVRDYVISFREDVLNDNIPLANMDEDIGDTYKINFNGQLFDYHKEIALYNGKNVKIVELIKDKKNYGTDSELKIQYENGEIIIINIKELDFPYNLNK